MSTPPLFWAGFVALLAALLALDLGVFHRKDREEKARQALWWVAFWVSLALLFNGGVYLWRGRVSAMEFLAGYLLEYSLSVDNIFVFLMIFSYFSIERRIQHRVLFWGILGAMIMRAVLITAGAALVARFHWVLYLFGIFLVFTGIKMALQRKDSAVDPARNPILRLFRRFFPVTPDYHGHRFFVRLDGRLVATPLFVVLLMVETTDLIFAFDSIPAIFAVTTDPFIIFTSNMFAIMGLRSLFFALAAIMDLFRFLKEGVSIVLVFVGVKMLLAETPWKIPIGVALVIIGAILGLSIAVSLAFPARPRK